MIEPLPGPGPSLDVLVARKLGLNVVNEAWNCYADPESGSIEPLHYLDPDFEEGDTGISYFRYPVYLEPDTKTFEDGSLGYEYEDGERWICWPPHKEPGSKYFSDRLTVSGLSSVKQYSTDIRAAWTLVEKYKLSLLQEVDDEDDVEWMCGPLNITGIGNRDGTDLSDVGVKFTNQWRLATTAPHAICLAFLTLPDEAVKQ